MTCGICGATEARPDGRADVIICLGCGAHKVRGGWQTREGLYVSDGEEKVVLPKNETRSDGTEASNYCVFASMESEDGELSDEVKRRAGITARD
jgi:hypothetical protein